MIVFKRTIPRLSAAALVLGSTSGCGDGGDDPGGGGSLLNRACESFQRCEPDAFAAEYASIAECVSAYEADLAELRMDYGDGCADAYLDLLECGYGVAAGTCEISYTDILTACSAEAAAYVSACE